MQLIERNADSVALIDVSTDIIVLLKSLEKCPNEFHLLRSVLKSELKEMGLEYKKPNLATAEDMELAGGVSE